MRLAGDDEARGVVREVVQVAYHETRNELLGLP